jgi:hypothetical protein
MDEIEALRRRLTIGVQGIATTKIDSKGLGGGYSEVIPITLKFIN